MLVLLSSWDAKKWEPTASLQLILTQTKNQLVCNSCRGDIFGLIVRCIVAKQFGATEFVNPKTINKPIQQHLVELTGGLDFTFECVGNVQTMVSDILCRALFVVCLCVESFH